VKTIITWVTVVALFFMTLPAPVYGKAPTNGESESGDPVGQEDVVFPSTVKVTPVDSAVVVAPTVGKIGVANAKIPFVNEFGELLDFKVDFSTSTWTIEDTSGVIAGGVLDDGQLETLTLYALDRLKPANQRTKNSATVIAIIGLIIAALALGFEIASYLNDMEQAGANASQQGDSCAANMARDTSNALAQGQAACPMDPVRTDSGSVCWSTPEYNNMNPSICLGITFAGCSRVCN